MWRLIAILVFVSTLTLSFIACIPEINITDNDSDGSNNDDPPFNDDDDDDDDDDDNDDDDDPVYESMLSESFEGGTFPPEGWEVVNKNPVYFLNWQRSDDRHYDGSYSAYVYSYFALGNELLYTKEVELIGYDSYEVTFWNFGAYNIFQGEFNPAVLSLEVSYDALNWTKIWNYNPSDWNDIASFYGDMNEFYQQERIDLGDYIGDTIRLGWRHKYTYDGSYAAYYWTIDDIKIWGINDK